MLLEQTRWPRIILIIMVAAATLYFLYLIRDVIAALLIGGILAYLIYHPVIFIERKGIKRTYGVLFLYLIGTVVLGMMLYWAIPATISEAESMIKMYPEIAEKAEQISNEIDGFSKPPEIDKLLKDNVDRLEKGFYKGLERFISGLYSLLGKIFMLIPAPIVAFYLVVDWEKMKGGFLNLFSPHFRRELEILGRDIDQILLNVIKGSIMVALLVGILVGFSAFFIGVKFPLLIWLISGLTNLIPFFGPFLGAVPAVIIAYSNSLASAIYMGLAIVVVQQIDSNLITPRILGGKLGLHPLFIIFALLAGGSLFGIWGLLLAVPAAAVLKVTVSWLYLRFVT